MKDRLLRCRCASGAHVLTTYAPLRFSRRLASGPFLNGLNLGKNKVGLKAKNG
jgi:hypothetical protein